MNLIDKYVHSDQNLLKGITFNDDGTVSITLAKYNASAGSAINIYAKHLAGTTALSIPYLSASKTTSYLTIGNPGYVLTITKDSDGEANGYLWIDPNSLDLTANNLKQSIHTNQSLTPAWTALDNLTTTLGDNSGSYIIQIYDGLALYSGIFSYGSSTTSDEEIILHSTNTSGAEYRLFAKTAMSGTNVCLFIASAKARLGVLLTIKYKQVI